MANKYSPEQIGVKAPSGGFQTGGWYGGRQYWNGTLSDAGVIHPDSNQQGAGSAVSDSVNAQSAVAQGSSVQNFNQYLSDLSVKDLQPSTSVPYTTNANSSYVTSLNSQVANARATLDNNIAGQRTVAQGQLAEAKLKETNAMGEVQKLTTPFRQELETAQREQLGVNQVLTGQKSLLDELDTLLTEGNDLIKQQKEVTGLASIRNPRVQKTMDDVAARAGVINAVVSLQNTYLSNAYTSIDRSVNAITQDRQDQLSYYETILNLANRDIVSLTAEDRKLAEQQTSLLADDLKRAQTTADYIKELMINPDTALVMAQSGVNLNDSVESINQKMARYQYTNEVREISNKMSTSGYSVVSSPKSVPANQLVSVTDSSGKTYYYRKNLSGDGFSSTSFLKELANMGYKVSGGDTKTNIIDTSSIWNEVLTGDNSTFAGKPNFTPAGGVGTPWTDSSGKKWTYGVEGWGNSTMGVGAN